MNEIKENSKEKYKKLFQDIRSSRTESNLQKIYEALLENQSELLNNDIIPLQFSNDLIWFLCNNIINLKTQSDIFKLYINSFFTFKLKSENFQKFIVLDQIFKYDSFIYKSMSETDNVLTAFKLFFEKYFPKNKKLNYEVGEIVDVFITDKSFGWVQMPIKKIENNTIIFDDCLNENKELKLPIDSYQIREKNSFVTEEEIIWRKNLKIGMKIDYLNNKKVWVEASVLNILSNNVVLWPLGNQKGDNDIESIFSPVIRPLNTFSLKYEKKEKQYFPFLTYNSFYSTFSYAIPMPKIEEGKETNFLVPYNYLAYFSFFFFDLFNYFINKLIHGKYLEESNEEKLTIEYIYKILDILNRGFEALNQLFFRQYFKDHMFPVIKKVLLKISKDKKKNISLQMFNKIVEILGKFGLISDYAFRQPKYFLDFYLNFGFNCFKESENLEKRIIGLNTILLALKSMEFFTSHNLPNDYNIIIFQTILTDNSDFFQLLFNKSDIHDQLILKGKEIVMTLYKQNLLDTKDINKLYNFAISSQEGTECYKQLYLILTEISKDMPLELSQNMLEKIISYQIEHLRREDIYLLFSLIKFIKNEKDYKKTINEALDYIYEFITNDIIKGENFINDFTETISSLIKNNDCLYFANYYLEKIINELLANKNLSEIEFFYDFLSYFIISFNSENKKIMKDKYYQILSNNNNSKILLNNLIKSIENDKDINKDDINSEKEKKHIISILDSIQSILYYIEYKFFFNIDSIMILCDIFIFSKNVEKKFLFFLDFLRRNELINIEEFCEVFYKKFDAYISGINKDNYYNYLNLNEEDNLETILNFYLSINHLNNDSNKIDYIDEYCFIKKNPLDFKYFNVLWKMFTKIDNSEFMQKFLEIFSLRLFSPKERYEIWQTIIKKIFNEQDNFVEPIIALNMINNIITFSEKFGTAGVIPHFLEKIKKIPMKLSISSKIRPIPDFELTENIYTTSTIYDVKKEIQKKFFIDPVLFELAKIQDNSYSMQSNSKILCYLFNLENNSNSSLSSLTKEQLEKKYNLSMDKSRELYNMKKLNLFDVKNPNQFNQKALSVFREIFSKVTHGKEIMDKSSYFDFYNESIANNNKSMDASAYNIFERYDRDKKGFWLFDNFIEFYLDSFKQNRLYQIFYNLNNFGYRNDLEFLNTPLAKNCPVYYQENNVCEYMPRYFIGNNMDYMNKLFSLSKSNDKSVHELVQQIINKLSTMTKMSNIFSEKNDKLIDDLLEKDNLEMRTYTFNIILSELEKNKEIDNKDIQLSINNFIEKNLEKIINNLNNFVDEVNEEILKNRYYNNKENTQYIQFLNYYHIMIQIILFSLKILTDNEQFFEIRIQIQSDLDIESKEKIMNDIISSLMQRIKDENLSVLKKLNYEQMFNIVISYLIMQKEKIKFVVYDIGFSYEILNLVFVLLEILDTNEINGIVKQKIYNKYITNIFNLCKNPIVKCKTLLEYSTKFITILKHNDKNFISLIKDETSKKILNFKSLNEYLLSRNYIFSIFKDLIIITFKKEDNNNNSKLFDIFKSIINIITNTNIILLDILITEYLELLSLIIKKLKEANYDSLYEYDFNNLLLLIISVYLINTTNNKNKIYSRYTDLEYIDSLFGLIKTIISIDPNKYIFTFFNNDDIKNLKTRHLSVLSDNKVSYDPKVEIKNEKNYLGLKNLSSLCYMNSVIQQLYMIPIFKKSILNLKINDEIYKLNEKSDLDDLLFQLIKMFYYLTYSDRSYYDPKQFVFSFKDYEGNPTNPNLQCDAQEFLTRFVEKIEEKIKNSKERFLFDNIFGGTTLQQIICTNSECRNISERREKIIYLSLDIKGNHTLEDCLDKFISEEKIEDYHCEKCDKKITNIKKVLIDKLPNILIIHLQRISFNYETFLMEKINDEINFEPKLNIKKYTVDKNNKNLDTEKYEYEYIGVIVHSGTAQSGHYYSIIKTNIENKIYKFNDTSVTEISYDNLQKEIVSDGRDYCPSAYMLLFQKKIKNPVIVNIREINDNTNMLNLLKDEKASSIQDNGINYDVYKDEKEAIEKNINNEINNKEIILRDNKIIGHLISYDNADNYIDIINTNKKEENIPFKSMILEENIKLCNDRKIFSYAFEDFIVQITKMIEISLETKNAISVNYIPIIQLINDYLLNIFSVCWFKNYLYHIVDNMIFIINKLPNILPYLIKDIIEPKKEIILYDYFLVKDVKLGEAFSFYFGKILALSIEKNIESETAVKIIDFYMEKIPVDISKKWMDMVFFNNFVYVLVENSEKIKKKLLTEEILSKLIDFILGKESPIYKGDERNDNNNIKGRFGPIVKSIALLYEYYINNKDKEEDLKISDQDELMINHLPFYEKIMLDNYDEKSSSLLIQLKLNSTLNANAPMDKETIDIIIKLKIPSSKSVENIISSISLIDKILSGFNDKKEIMNIIFGIPSIFLENEEAKFCYVSGGYFNYYSILQNIASYNQINDETIPLLLNIFKLIFKYPDVYSYLNKLPAPNSYTYTYIEYLIKLYIEAKDKASINNDKANEEKNNYDELNALMTDFCKKYDIDLEKIKIDKRICVSYHMYIFMIKFDLIKEMKDLSQDILNVLKNCEDKIKFFYIMFKYYLIEKVNNFDLKFFSEKINIQYHSSSEKTSNLSNLNLPEHSLEGIFIQGNKDCNFSFSIEPYINSTMEVSIKENEKYILFIKDYNLLVNDSDSNNDILIDFDLSKLKVNELQKYSKGKSKISENNKIQTNENAVIINCPLCGTPNAIDEDNQTFTCIVCSASLL